jgi:hypothetical protein
MPWLRASEPGIVWQHMQNAHTQRGLRYLPTPLLHFSWPQKSMFESNDGIARLADLGGYFSC